jgi:transposase
LEARQTLDHQPRSCLPQEKKRRDRLIRLVTDHPRWALGFADEVWWSRLAQPAQHRWTEPEVVPKLHALERPKGDADPQAVACYGLLVRQRPHHLDQLLLRFVEGRPVSAVTTAFLAWCSNRLAAQGVTARVMIWDNASWHISQEVQTWLRTHNQTTKRTGQGVRIVPCRLPTKSPWLNPIEPKWVHGKRAVSDPAHLLSAAELEARVCAYYRCVPEVHLVMPKKVA